MQSKDIIASTNALETLNRIEKEFENIADIRSRLYKVHDLKLTGRNFQKVMCDLTGNKELIVEDPDTQIIIAETGEWLGTTGVQYKSMQSEAFLDLLLQMVEDCGGALDLSKLSYTHWDNKRQIEFTLPLDNLSFKNRIGGVEDVKRMISFRTGFGGNYRHIIGDYSWRQICSNGMMGWGANSQIKLKHTRENNKKVVREWCTQLKKVIGSIEETNELWKRLDKVEVSQSRVNAFVRKIAEFGKDDKLDTVSSRKLNIYNTIQEAIAEEFAITGASAYGLLQGVTRYTNHYASGSGDEYIRTMKGFDTNNLAQKLVIDMLN